MRQEKLLNSLRPCTAGVTRSCRSRRPISYTYEDYDRAIDEAIKITKKRKTIEEQSNNGIHTPKIILRRDTSQRVKMKVIKPHEVDDDDDSKRDHDNGSGPDKSDKENENFGDKKRCSEVWFSSEFKTGWSCKPSSPGSWKLVCKEQVETKTHS
ncbi:hypothetical protein OIU74_028258 [Salix koriyanagi]|uniref:Uncharacterized protein n=1 Tax=Salix koriyanagi TaxID=2511006 RepID=A0A9Q0VB72_9ROSI|nr:hypothetical protein OIU74_028258 [Salix koriyanagi]